MKVKILETGKTADYDASYAARLVEQGKAIPAKEKAAPADKPEPAEKPAEEKPKSRKKQEG